MKKTYFSTFAPGLEKPIDAMLRKEGGVAVERVLPGAALYRSVREPSLPYARQTFLVLFEMKPVKSVDDALRRLMETGGWLDRFPYEETQGKRFRIVTAMGDQLVAANMRQVDRLERAICDQTGMHTQRERPDVELWVLCRPEASYFLWRIGKRPIARQEGALRPDVCAVAAFLADCGAKEAAVLGCTGASLPQALRQSGARTTCVCPDGESAARVSRRGDGLRVIEAPSGHTGLLEASQNAVLLPLAPSLARSEESDALLRGALHEASRILRERGRLVVVGPTAAAAGVLRRAADFAELARYALTLSGQPCAIWLLQKAEGGEGA